MAVLVKFWKQITEGLRMLILVAPVYQGHLQKKLPKFLSELYVQNETEKRVITAKHKHNEAGSFRRNAVKEAAFFSQAQEGKVLTPPGKSILWKLCPALFLPNDGRV